MRIFINYVTDRRIYNLDNSNEIYINDELRTNLQSSDKITIIVVNYPGTYTGIRKSIAIAKAFSVCYNNNTELYGFSVFTYLNSISVNNFFIDGYMYWTNDNKIGPLNKINEHFDQNKKYISNISTEISDAVDCKSHTLMRFINIKHEIPLSPLQQIYYDKFST